MKKTISTLLVLCLLFALLLTYAAADSEGTSPFTARIDKYWQEHDIGGIMEARGNTEEKLAANRALMMPMYGENQQITGEYNESLAAKTVRR